MTLYKLKLRNGIREEYIAVNLDKFACAEALDSGRHSSVIRLHFEGVPHDTIVDWETWQDLKTRLLRMSQRGVNSLDRDPTTEEFDPYMSSNTMYDEIVQAAEAIRLSEPFHIANDMFAMGDMPYATTTASSTTTTGGAT